MYLCELNRSRMELGECGTMLEKQLYPLNHIGTIDRLPDGLRTETVKRKYRESVKNEIRR